MTDWNELMRGLAPREDLQEDFPAESLDQDHPVLVGDGSLQAAGAVAVRVLEIISRRGGTRVAPSALETLRELLRDGLTDSAANLCDDEARRILRWLREGRESTGELIEVDGPPEVEVMYKSDLDSRISVAEFALREGFDLELEFYDTARETWPRLRCTPIAIQTDEDDDLVEIEFEAGGVHREVPLRQVRWLMPVTRRQHAASASEDGGAEIITFPAGRDEADQDGDDADPDENGDL